MQILIDVDDVRVRTYLRRGTAVGSVANDNLAQLVVSSTILVSQKPCFSVSTVPVTSYSN